MDGGDHSLKVLSPLLIRFWCEGGLKRLVQKDDLLNQLTSDQGVLRTAPAKPSLLKNSRQELPPNRKLVTPELISHKV